MRTLLIALLLVIFIITPCVAKTPDGKTPHEETICDGETGAAFGLCNAYCEAMDCDSENPHASEKACSKIKSLFTKRTGRDLICSKETPELRCPCLDDIPEFAAFLKNIDDFMYCYDTGTGALLGIGDIANVEIITNGIDEIPICAYSNDDVFDFVEITYEELDSCENLLIDAIVNADLYCE